MSVITDAVLLLILKLILSEGTCIDNRSEENFWELLLRNHLTRDYYAMEPPHGDDMNCTRVMVKLKIIPLQLKFDSDNGLLTVYGKLITIWKDQRLNWDPIKYGNIQGTYLSTSRIWTPELEFYNTDYERHQYRPCSVSYLKNVVCSWRFVHGVNCNLRLSNWPYDRQKCFLAIGAVATSPITLNYLNGSASMDIWTARVGGGWDLIDFIVANTSSNLFTFEFVIERRATLMSLVVISPFIIITMLTLSSLALDLQNSLRLFVLSFSLMCHFYFLDLVSDISTKSLDLPSILLYFRGSIIVTSLNLLSVFALTLLCTKDTEVPRWVSTINKYVYISPIKFILPVIEDRAKFIHFAYVLNVGLIFVTTVVYVGLYLGFMPFPYTHFSNVDKFTSKR